VGARPLDAPTFRCRCVSDPALDRQRLRCDRGFRVGTKRGTIPYFHAETIRCSHYRSIIKPMGCGIVQIAGVLAAHRASVDDNGAMTAPHTLQLATAAGRCLRMRFDSADRSRSGSHFSRAEPSVAPRRKVFAIRIGSRTGRRGAPLWPRAARSWASVTSSCGCCVVDTGSLNNPVSTVNRRPVESAILTNGDQTNRSIPVFAGYPL